MTLARVRYDVATHVWQTPHGRPVEFAYRRETSDWNTVSSVMAGSDEYGLRDVSLTGTAIDVGAHIGSVAIALAVDNPGLRVIAVEALAENCELLAQNAERNGVADRVSIVCRAAAAPGIASTDVFWRAQGTETSEHHAFIGNSALVYDHGDQGHETATVKCVSLSALTTEPIAFLKIDCEGCEWGFLTDPKVAEIPLIVGEWHPTGGHTSRDLVPLLAHALTVTGPPEGPGGFRAVLR